MFAELAVGIQVNNIFLSFFLSFFLGRSKGMEEDSVQTGKV
jgi:hypothetical protein